MKKHPIVILGGMGPEASAYLYDIMIQQSVDLFKAVNNDDFPEIILYSIPIPDFISSIKRQEEALKILKKRVRKLNKLNPLCMAIACNTAHTLLNDLQNVSKATFVSMIDEVVIEVRKDGFKNVGLLGTPSTIKSNIYQKAFERIKVKTLIPKKVDLNALEIIIRNIIAGKINEADTVILKKISNSLVKKGAQAIILGCTELPLIYPSNFGKKIYNSLEILSKSLLVKYYQQ